MKKMNKNEKKFVKFIYKQILDIIESTDCKFKCFDEWSSYGISQLKEEQYDEIEELIVRAQERGVNEKIIEKLVKFNVALFNNEI